MDTQPLLQSLQDLVTAHETCIDRTEDLIAALVATDVVKMRAAVAAQTVSLQSIEQAELRRRLAVRGLTYTLMGGTARGDAMNSAITGPTTFTALLRTLSPEEAAPLVEARRTLLAVVLRLQVLQRRAATLAHAGQTVVQRTLRAALGTQGEGYGTAGMQAVPVAAFSGRQGRWA